MRKIKKIFSIIICIALCSCLFPMGTAKAATDFKAPVKLIKLDDDGNTISETSLGDANVVLKNNNKPYDTYNPEEGIVLQEYIAAEDDVYSLAGVVVDEGYDAFVCDMYFINFTAASWNIEDVIQADITFKVPEGYSPATVKRIYQHYLHEGSAQKVNCVSYTDTTVTLSVDLCVRAHDYYADPKVWGLKDELLLEMKKTQDISQKTAVLSAEEFTYTGSPITPEVKIEGLTKDVDFKVEYSNNIEVGEGTVTITGIGAYKGKITKTFKIKAKEYSNSEYVDETGGANYIVNTDANGNTTAIYTGPTNKKSKKITIPSSITLPDGTTAKVTQIDANAFKGSKAKQITIPSTVTKISSKAFAGSEAKKIIIKTDKKGNISIGKGAFKNMKAKNVQIVIKGCKGKAKDKLVKKIKKQAPKGTKVK
ncbi:Leucine rich repeat-containing protein [Butyrivibrio sp. ob235]|uniref:leucine-rich repeat protein n=1 Tax=Butyrivibrio sp. ob235 TaxID=1761780 RepID=UPI0008CBB8C4|nr:leucine-rich repeat protein [Butyrivibrio sp. ob235]SEK25397.1 Leucine rich repeat-containing protein [Butyrivibrio sp. ob235]